MPNNLLLTSLEKLLIYLDLETHLNKEHSDQCNEDFFLLTPHVCKYKQDNNIKQQIEDDDMTIKKKESSIIDNSMVNYLNDKENKFIIEEFEIKNCYCSPSSSLVVTLDENSKVSLYKIDKFCEKIEDLPHLISFSQNTNEVDFNLLSVDFDVYILIKKYHNNHFSTCSNDYFLRIWNSRGYLKQFIQVANNVEILRFSKQDNKLLYLVNDEIILWNYDNNENVFSYSNLKGKKKFLFRINNIEFVTFQTNGVIKFWQSHLKLYYKQIYSVSEDNFLLDSILTTKNHFVTLSKETSIVFSKLILWEFISSQKLEELEIYEGNIDFIVLIHNNNNGFPIIGLVINKKELKFLLWHPNKKLIPILIFQNDITLIKVSESSKFLVVVDIYGLITILRLDASFQYMHSTINRVKEEIIDIKWTEKETSLICVTKQNILIINDF